MSPEARHQEAQRACDALRYRGPEEGVCVRKAWAEYEESRKREIATAWAVLTERADRLALEEAERTRVREEALAAVRSDPIKLRLAVSIAVCVTDEIEAQALAGIKEEKENSRIAGVVNAAKLLQLQNKVAEQRKLRPRLLAMLGKGGKPHPCKSKELKPIWHCLSVYSDALNDAVGVDDAKLPPECAAAADQALARLPVVLIRDEETKLRTDE